MTRSAALFVGDVSFDLTMTVSHVPEPDEKVHAGRAIESAGGVGANSAVACARAGVPTRLAVGIGDDVVGRMLVDQLTASGVEVLSCVYPGPTTRVVNLIEPHGEKRLILHPGVSMYPRRPQIAALSFEDVGWVHTAVYDHSAAELLIDQCRVRAIPWSLDLEPSTFPNGLDRLRDFIDGAAIVFCNARSADSIGQEPVERLFAMGARAVVRTQGAAGATLHGAKSRSSFAAPRGVAIDTTGAGDCLAGWFVAERLRGAASDEALKAAIAAATISCGRLGGQSSYPTREEVAISTA